MSSPSSSYEDAYKTAFKSSGGEQYILSAVMHAIEINRAMTEALGRRSTTIFMVYVPVVEEANPLVETLQGQGTEAWAQSGDRHAGQPEQEWASKPLLDTMPESLSCKERQASPEEVVPSILQDNFFNFMRAGYDIERGERGSTEEHLTVAQFKKFNGSRNGWTA